MLRGRGRKDTAERSTGCAWLLKSFPFSLDWTSRCWTARWHFSYNLSEIIAHSSIPSFLSLFIFPLLSPDHLSFFLLVFLSSAALVLHFLCSPTFFLVIFSASQTDTSDPKQCPTTPFCFSPCLPPPAWLFKNHFLKTLCWCSTHFPFRSILSVLAGAWGEKNNPKMTILSSDSQDSSRRSFKPGDVSCSTGISVNFSFYAFNVLPQR